MTKFYQDYLWKNGSPYGVKALLSDLKGESYKIAADPYRKRISVEKYVDGAFDRLIYDSVFIDFRHLKSEEHTAWEKTVIEESSDKIKCILRNQDDRIVFFETYRFKEGKCVESTTYTPQGFLLSEQKIFYTAFGDRCDGIFLYDANQHLVMYKKYSLDESTGEFKNILEENWEISLEPKRPHS